MDHRSAPDIVALSFIDCVNRGDVAGAPDRGAEYRFKVFDDAPQVGHDGVPTLALSRASCTLWQWRCFMRNVTLSADEALIDAARQRAHAENTTLNQEFRHWLRAYAFRENRAARAIALIRELQSEAGTGGRHFSRDEMNER